jgi:hypothetical protein
MYFAQNFSAIFTETDELSALLMKFAGAQGSTSIFAEYRLAANIGGDRFKD